MISAATRAGFQVCSEHEQPWRVLGDVGQRRGFGPAGQRHVTLAIALRQCPDVLGAKFLQLAPDVQDVVPEVEVLGGQRQRLADAQAAGRHQHGDQAHSPSG
jgi:hypothetical protein